MTNQAMPAEAVEAAESRHAPFVWDFGFGPVTSCRECADHGVDQAEAEWPCSFATKDQPPAPTHPKPSGNSCGNGSTHTNKGEQNE